MTVEMFLSQSCKKLDHREEKVWRFLSHLPSYNFDIGQWPLRALRIAARTQEDNGDPACSHFDVSGIRVLPLASSFDLQFSAISLWPSIQNPSFQWWSWRRKKFQNVDVWTLSCSQHSWALERPSQQCTYLLHPRMLCVEWHWVPGLVLSVVHRRCQLEPL